MSTLPTLRSCADAPQLPAGYATMIILAAVPPLCRVVCCHHAGDVIRPPCRLPVPVRRTALSSNVSHHRVDHRAGEYAADRGARHS
ncbi:hypothetical protein C5E44_06540 [Nocardia nova]|nr:hypothetical protein C5E44_06540 [Nocardia nova]